MVTRVWVKWSWKNKVYIGLQRTTQNATTLESLSIFFFKYTAITLSWWRLQMEAFSALLVLCEGNWIPLTKVSDAEFCFLWFGPEQTVEQTNETLVIQICGWTVVQVTFSAPSHGPLARCVKLLVVHAPGMPGTFSPPPRVNDPDMHRGVRDARVVMHVGIAD